jgi:hypothetical protein
MPIRGAQDSGADQSDLRYSVEGEIRYGGVLYDAMERRDWLQKIGFELSQDETPNLLRQAAVRRHSDYRCITYAHDVQIAPKPIMRFDLICREREFATAFNDQPYIQATLYYTHSFE